MKRREMQDRGYKYTLVARGPASLLDRALDAVESLIKGNMVCPTSGILEAYDCTVTIRNEIIKKAKQS